MTLGKLLSVPQSPPPHMGIIIVPPWRVMLLSLFIWYLEASVDIGWKQHPTTVGGRTPPDIGTCCAFCLASLPALVQLERPSLSFGTDLWVTSSVKPFSIQGPALSSHGLCVHPSRLREGAPCQSRGQGDGLHSSDFAEGSRTGQLPCQTSGFQESWAAKLRISLGVPGVQRGTRHRGDCYINQVDLETGPRKDPAWTHSCGRARVGRSSRSHTVPTEQPQGSLPLQRLLPES